VIREHVLTPTGALRAWGSFAINALVIAVLCAFTITYVTRQNRKICGVIVLIDDRNQQLPPADPDTMDFRRELHHYRESLGC
jgi:hypothetical protein